jgi:hypothetical protein
VDAPLRSSGTLLVLRDRNQQLVVRENGVLLDISISVDALESRGQPVGEGKVDGLVEVEAVVESRVVRAGEGDDKLVGTLVTDDDTHAVLLETSRRHEGDELEEEVGLLFEEFRGCRLHGSLELLIIGSRYSIPRLGVTKGVKVDWGMC